MGRVDLQPHHDGAMHALNADGDERAAPMRRGRSSRLRGYRAVGQVERYRPEAERLRRAEPELYAKILEQAKKDPEAEAAAARDPDLREAVDQRSEQIERRFEKPIVIAALLVIPIMVLEHTAAGEPWSTLATVANWLIWGLFAAEVVVMLAVVPDRRRWPRREHSRGKQHPCLATRNRPNRAAPG